MSIDGVNAATLTEAIANDDYLEYTFSIDNPLPDDWQMGITGIHIYEAGSGNLFDRTIAISEDPTFAEALPVVPLNRQPTHGVSTELDFTTPVMMVPGTTYYVRVYMYNPEFPGSSVSFDDFAPKFTAWHSDDTVRFEAGDPPVAIDPPIADDITLTGAKSI